MSRVCLTFLMQASKKWQRAATANKTVLFSFFEILLKSIFFAQHAICVGVSSFVKCFRLSKFWQMLILFLNGFQRELYRSIWAGAYCLHYFDRPIQLYLFKIKSNKKIQKLHKLKIISCKTSRLFTCEVQQYYYIDLCNMHVCDKFW